MRRTVDTGSPRNENPAMDVLPAILESMRLSLIATTALVAFGFTVMTLMLYRQSRTLRDIAEMLRGVSKQVSDSEALLRDTHALTAKAAAALENVTRLVVHPGGRT
jgi:hypothetical protein